jgi:serine/threonine-protein kinase
MSEGDHAYGPSSEPMSGEPETDRGDPSMIGRLVSGKYTIEKFLGGGAMGAVYKARFAALEKNVAVKVMHRSVAVDPNFVGRFHREAKAASRLDHPNSIRVIDFGEEPDGLLYIAMEYVEGRDLYSVIHEDWPISNADIGDIVMQALAAIAVAHEMGVIHRDLKPENLMMLRAKNDDEKDAYVVKVCDFGIAKITENEDEPKTGGPGGQKLTTQGLVVGTPEYMSPEQARGEKLDPRSDIYSMGIILYQLLTGRTPFTGDNALAVVLKHITEAPSAPSVHYAGVHKGLEAITLKAIAKDRNERFQTARAMRNAIREALEGRPMPVDIAAATLEAPQSSLPGTAPMVVAGGMAPLEARGVTGPGPAVEAAPTVAGGITPSTLTPLGSAATAPSAAKKSRAGLFVGIALVAIVGGGAGLAAMKGTKGLHHEAAALGDSAIKALSNAPTAPTAPVAPTGLPSALAVTPAIPTTPDLSPPPSPADPKHPKSGRTPGKQPPAEAVAPVGAGVPPPPPPVAVVVPSVPEPPPPPPVPVVPTPPPPPAVPAFNPTTCRATAGQVRSNGGTNAKDLTLNGTAAAWTTCAQRSLHEKPSSPITGNVHLAFTDNGSFRGATCASCPAPLAQCIATSTGRTAIYKNRSGDVTGDPAFDVAITVTCD